LLPLLLLLAMQVHNAHHSTVPSLGPILSTALQQQLQYSMTAAATPSTLSAPDAAAAISPFYVHSACFAGCVQLIANVYMLANPGGRSGCNSRSSSDDTAENSSSSSSSSSKRVSIGSSDKAADDQALPVVPVDHQRAASGLLARTSGMLSAAAAAQTAEGQFWGGEIEAVDGVGMLPHRIDAMVGGAAVTTRSSSSSSSNSSSSSLASQASGSSDVRVKPAAAAAAAAASLMHCQPCCLVAEQSQDLQLTVNFTLEASSSSSGCASSSGGGSSGVFAVPCRLLAVQQGQVVVDEDVAVTVQQQAGRNRACIR
jgi:hypothetical protein